ncbi:MAG: 1,4-beta-xylanase [Planctomycetota bacterium]
MISDDTTNGQAVEATTIEGRWEPARIKEWHDRLPWLVGANYYPATAINQIDMWQASTFDLPTIEAELDLAASIGMNTHRVYLHDLVWGDDAAGLYDRMDRFLGACAKRGIRPFFVFFDDCHHPTPTLGEQPAPVIGWHNSAWLNCPARRLGIEYAAGKADPADVDRLHGYVEQTIRHFADDDRVLMWELYNEPGNGLGIGTNPDGSDRPIDDSKIGDTSARLIRDAFVWARAAKPSQPVCSNCRGGIGDLNIELTRANTDLFSIHNYGDSADVRGSVEELRAHDRPIVMTEWLARDRGSTVADCLPVMKELGVGAINWGFVVGKTQTHFNWASRRRFDANGVQVTVDRLRAEGQIVRPGDTFPAPDLWFHDIFRPNHTPYDESEVALFRQLTGVNADADAPS